MKLSTIWTMPMMSTTERFLRTWDLGFMTLARKLPRRLKYYVTLQQIGKATMDSPNVPATTLEEILKNLESPKRLS